MQSICGRQHPSAYLLPACALAYSGRMELSPHAAPVPPPGVGTPPGGGIPATLVKFTFLSIC